ncbi:MAG: hypothetical protein DWP97_09700 [Calditrichaeota bacterium]|nr:MAG: hypothetical protein DWP97_09700 [Calditrichota bacterium]
MVELLSLWMPILLSAVFVFIVSSLIHMVLGYHKNDFLAIPSETEIRDALRGFNMPPGEYMVPRAGNMAEYGSEEFKQKVEKGPVFMITVMENKIQSMGPALLLWFIYSLIVSIFAGYLASRTLDATTHYLTVFRVVGTMAFVGYALALLQNSIWYKRAWSVTLNRCLMD